jgi:16S rRNA (uracil1498-N3)-methyltransferase
MAPPRGEGPAPVRRFRVAPDGEGRPRLLDEELPHALRVLRLTVGDRLVGLDGAGRSWPLVVTRATRRELDVVADGEPTEVPAPGTPGAALPSIEVAVALPKPSRAEALVERLTQLGVDRITPLVTERTTTKGAAPKRAKLERVALEACKQCARAWFPTIGEPVPLARWLEALDAPATHLDASGGTRLLDWADGRTGAERVAVLVGPEGGWSDDEREALHRAGVGATWLAPHVLRTETAAEAAAAVLVQRLAR